MEHPFEYTFAIFSNRFGECLASDALDYILDNDELTAQAANFESLCLLNDTYLLERFDRLGISEGSKKKNLSAKRREALAIHIKENENLRSEMTAVISKLIRAVLYSSQ